MASQERDIPAEAGSDFAGDEPAHRVTGRRDTRPGERRPGYVPKGTATEEPPLEGSSLDAPVAQGTYRPDVGPGGADIDEGDQVLPNRARAARGPERASESPS